MATITRRYALTGPSATDLGNAVGNAAVSVSPASVSVDVEFDDALDGVTETLDQFMAEEWFSPEQNNPPTETSLILRSPDGTLWRVQVTDLGALTVVPA